MAKRINSIFSFHKENRMYFAIIFISSILITISVMGVFLIIYPFVHEFGHSGVLISSAMSHTGFNSTENLSITYTNENGRLKQARFNSDTSTFQMDKVGGSFFRNGGGLFVIFVEVVIYLIILGFFVNKIRNKETRKTLKSSLNFVLISFL